MSAKSTDAGNIVYWTADPDNSSLGTEVGIIEIVCGLVKSSSKVKLAGSPLKSSDGTNPVASKENVGGSFVLLTVIVTSASLLQSSTDKFRVSTSLTENLKLVDPYQFGLGTNRSWSTSLIAITVLLLD